MTLSKRWLCKLRVRSIVPFTSVVTILQIFLIFERKTTVSLPLFRLKPSWSWAREQGRWEPPLKWKLPVSRSNRWSGYPYDSPLLRDRMKMTDLSGRCLLNLKDVLSIEMLSVDFINNVQRIRLSNLSWHWLRNGQMPLNFGEADFVAGHGSNQSRYVGAFQVLCSGGLNVSGPVEIHNMSPFVFLGDSIDHIVKLRLKSIRRVQTK